MLPRLTSPSPLSVPHSPPPPPSSPSITCCQHFCPYPTLPLLTPHPEINEDHEGKRKCESIWPIHQINWQRSRYVWDMYKRYKMITKEIYDYCVEQKLCDAALVAKWRKPGYERLCSTMAINSKNSKFGTVSICRVPRQNLSKGQVVRRGEGARGRGGEAKGGGGAAVGERERKRERGGGRARARSQKRDLGNVPVSRLWLGTEKGRAAEEIERRGCCRPSFCYKVQLCV